MGKRHGVGLLAGFLLAGCVGVGGYQLVVTEHGAGLGESVQWRVLSAPCDPRDRLEEAAVKSVRKRGEHRDGDLTGVMLWFYGDWYLTAVVEDHEPSPDRFRPKRITWYRVEENRITALCGPREEPFLDYEMEKAIMIAAMKALSGSSVVPYNDGLRGYTLRGVAEHGCVVSVKVMAGYNQWDEPVMFRKVNLCFDWQ